ncbi:MAG: VRR-NUC domain-containing protein [Clostridiales bacterium]|nr:VRR-NUC domain-containing protein [Clostridiales bacterium]
MHHKEDAEQIVVAQWAACRTGRYPELKWLFHVPNGGSRNQIEAVKLKEMGVKAGVSDLCLPYPKGKYCGLFVEMKARRNKLTEKQTEFLSDMAEAGHFVATCYSAEDAIQVIEEYCNLSGTMKMKFQNNSIIKDEQIIKPKEPVRRQA